MPSVLTTVLFWSAALAVVVAQAMILRSTARAWSQSASPAGLRETLFAWGPALVLAVVLYWSWRAAVAPPIVQVEFLPGSSGIRL